MEAQFLDHYNRELGYLRELGGEFAAEYPAVAGRLGLDEFSCADPYVERLLEGFAFLAARVHLRLDSEFPRFTGGLLQAIYPHYSRPIPAAAIVSFQPDADEGSLAAGYRLPKGTKLRGPCTPQSPTPCQLKTTSDVRLWPLRLTSVELVDRDAVAQKSVPEQLTAPAIRSCLRITLETTAGLPVSALQLDELCLHLRGGEIACQLLELLLAHGQTIVAGTGDNDLWHRLPSGCLQHAGFDADEALLPPEPRSFGGYRLLQEYFLLPEKFQFVKLQGLRSAAKQIDGNRMEIVIGLDAADRQLSGRIKVDHFALHCTPAINLFEKRADRVQIADTVAEHHLIVDRSRPMDFEIWSVERLHGHGRTPQQEIEFLPLYAPPTRMASRQQHGAYYTLERRPRQPSANQREYGHRSPYLGSEVFVTLTDSNQQPARHKIRQLSSSVHCTNRDLAMIRPAGGWQAAFKLDTAGPVSAVHCLTGPTTPRAPLTRDDGQRCWRLINHLQTNLLSLCGEHDQSTAPVLREMLSLYCPPELPQAHRQVDGILSLQTETVTRQLPFEGPIVHGRGVQVDLELDEAAFEGSGAFLFASVLERFMAQYVTLNSFTQVSLHTPSRGPIHSWPVRTGVSPLI